MSATPVIAAILTLKDQLSAPLRGAQNALGGLQDRLKSVQSGAQRTAEALRGVSSAVSGWATTSVQIAAVGQLATGFGLESYLRNSIGVEHRLAALGNTANMSKAELQALDARLAAASRATNQFKADLLTANEQLIAAGLEWQKALDITPVLGKVATATQASMGDLAQTAYALTSNLRVPVEQMQAAFERLTVAGQSGQFELKDMAREFAKLGASMGALKFTGLENVSRLGAALQIARRGAGDASEAANNLQNFLAKLAAPDVQKNFKKFGIDLPRLLKGARERGLDPFLITLKAVRKATGGDEFKLGELFGDMQVQNFVKPMLLYTEDYKRLVGEIRAANGVIEGNFGRMMNTTAERWKQFRIQLDTTPMPWLDSLIDKLSGLLTVINRYPKTASAIATGLVGIAGAAIVLKTASMALSGLAGLIGIGRKISGWRQARTAASMTIGGAASGATALDPSRAAGKAALAGSGWMLLTQAWQKLTAWSNKLQFALLSLGKILGWLGRAVTLNPIGLALMSAALLVYKFWGPIQGFFVGLWNGLSQGARALSEDLRRAWAPAALLLWPLLTALSWLGSKLQAAIGWLSAWVQPMDDAAGAARNLGEKIGLYITNMARMLLFLPNMLMTLPTQMLAIGRQIIDGLLAGMRERWAALKETVSGIGSSISGWVKDKLGIRSPSRVFAEIGGHLMGGLRLGIERAAALPLSAMRGVAAGLATPITAGAMAFAPLAQAVDPIVLPEPTDAVRTIRQAVDPIVLPEPPGTAAPQAPNAAPIQITVNLNGPASPEAAQDVAAAVRREVERAMAEQARRDALARRARLIDGGIA